jgi:filamentous hemagglutinin family protein
MAKLYIGLSWLRKTTLISCIFISSPISAQIVPDTTLPQNSKITTEDNTSVIGEGSKVGSNLFHSFEQFSVPTGNTAYFNNSLDVQNIISRVTGSSVSEIDGLIRSNGNANFFLLNPNGIIFNTNARIETGGSFLASTANHLSFADGTQFKTNTNQSAPLLTVSVPVGLGFGSNPKKIIVRGDGQGQRFTSELVDTESGLQIRSNKTLALVGGDLELEGATIKTAGGRVELGSVVGTGLVGLDFNENGFSLDYSNIPTFGNIQLSQKTVVDASGLGGGNIQVRGRQISLLDSSELYSATLGSEPGDSINIEASESVKISGLASNSQSPSFIGTPVFEEGTTGVGGNIIIKTEKLFVQNGGGIQASTFGEGNAGNLTIDASEVEVSGVASNSRFEFGSGIVTSVFEGAKGSAGDLVINTDHLSVQNGSQIQASTFGIGSAGNITVNARKVEVIGTYASRDGNEYRSALLTSSESEGIGVGGNLTINAEQLNILNGASISTSTFSRGAAGNLVINVGKVELSGTSAKNQFGSNLAARTLGIGDAGSLKIKIDFLTLRDKAEVTVSSEGLGRAGSLNIEARSVQLNTSGKLVSETTSGQGGNISLKTQNLLIQNNSQISSNAGTLGTGGDGGNIIINTDTLVALENSKITARAFEGNGGNIQISTQGLFLSPDSEINASSRFGVDGVVQTQVLGFDIGNSLTPLKNNLVTPEQVIKGSCLARRNAQQGSFVVTGSGGLPINPYSGTETWDEPENTTYQSSSSLNNSNPIEVTPKKWQPGDPIVEAQTLIVTADGRGLLRTRQQTEIANSESLVCRTEQANN